MQDHEGVSVLTAFGSARVGWMTLLCTLDGIVEEGNDVVDGGLVVEVVVAVLPEVLAALGVRALGKVTIHKRGLLACPERFEIFRWPCVVAWVTKGCSP